MEKPYRNNKIIMFLLIFLLVVLFPNGSYSIQKDEKIPKQVIVGGELLQLDIKTSKLMFYKHENDEISLKNYDMIESLEGEIIEKLYNQKSIRNISKKDMLKLNLKMKDDEKVKVVIIRNESNIKLLLSKKELHHSFFIDKVPFSATLTYINPCDNSFGAVGHNINLNKNKKLLSQNGNLYLCNLSQLQKSSKNNIGYMQGNMIYNKQGTVNRISNFGAKGKIIGDEIFKNNDIYEVGKKSKVKNGQAQLIIKDKINSDKHYYDINITKINKQNKPETQSFEFQVTDKELIENYGGIVQGMSGCPIIQNGKLIGALSHVICSDTTKGVGVYIQWMMEE